MRKNSLVVSPLESGKCPLLCFCRKSCQGVTNFIGLVLLSALLSACTSNDDDGSLIGTGNGIIDADGLPAYHRLTDSVPATQVQSPGGIVMNFAPNGSIADICPPFFVTSVVESGSSSEWTEPANGFRGNWRGVTREGFDLNIVLTVDDVAHGNSQASLSLRSNPQLTVSSIESSPSTLIYSVEETEAIDSGTEIFTERYELVGDDSLVYTIENERMGEDTIQLNRISATELLTPPTWLQGEWANECENRTVSGSTITMMSTASSIDIASELTGESSAFRVNNVDENTYRYTATIRNDDGEYLRFSEEYELQEGGISIISGSNSKELVRN